MRAKELVIQGGIMESLNIALKLIKAVFIYNMLREGVPKSHTHANDVGVYRRQGCYKHVSVGRHRPKGWRVRPMTQTALAGHREEFAPLTYPGPAYIQLLAGSAMDKGSFQTLQ